MLRKLPTTLRASRMKPLTAPELLKYASLEVLLGLHRGMNELMSRHCCEAMTRAVATECDQHPDRFDCPDALLHYSAKFDEYGIIVHDGGSATCSIAFCPWCGAHLPESRRDRWFDELERLGISDPWVQEIPPQFQSDEWWRTSS